jgi:hypothetical protein
MGKICHHYTAILQHVRHVDIHKRQGLQETPKSSVEYKADV